jgi:O-antigen ligase
MQEGIKTFVQYPLTGIGAGQFQNYNPAGRKEAWRQTHNAMIQVAAETGALGLAAFSFLIVCAAAAAARTRKMLTPPRRKSTPDAAAVAFDPHERRLLYAHCVAMTAGLAGWFVCSMFASVAYSWTFYYVLALIVAGRELVRDRIGAVRSVETARSNTVSPHRQQVRRALAVHAR